MKTCTKCGVNKSLFDFHKQKDKPFGVRYQCKSCVREYESSRYDKNANFERCKSYQEVNRGKMNAISSKRRAARLNATPPWLNKEDLAAIQQFYTIANQLTELNGVVHHVDHIIPLQGKTVCGLHVPWNLRVLEGAENTSKSNKLVLPAEMMWV